jgi:light-regulated signal transduction histidine kinase (bacteriophytochrome)
LLHQKDCSLDVGIEMIVKERLIDRFERKHATYARVQVGKIDPAKLLFQRFSALHELATNAAKYGALSGPEGRVDIRWQVQDDQLNMSWRESGGPPVLSPSRRGFGSRLIENALCRDLDGQSRLEFAPEGATCCITAAISANPSTVGSPI